MADDSRAISTDGAREDAESSEVITIDRLISTLARQLTLQHPDRALKAKYLGKLAEHGERTGFTAHEAEQILRIALRGASGGKGMASSDACRLVKSVRPAAGVLFDEQLVLLILGSLGGDAEKAMGMTGLRDPDDSDASFSDESDVDIAESIEERAKKKKTRADMRVQVYALRLLIQLHSTPPLSSLGRRLSPSWEQQDRSKVVLPRSFLTHHARTVLERCYGVLFHYLDYQNLQPYICHLLCLITRRKHVLHYRIAKVLDVRTMLPGDPYINALLRAFSSFYPDLLYVAASSTPAAVSSRGSYGLKYPQSKWLVDVYEIWCNNPATKARSSFGKTNYDDAVDSLTGMVPYPTMLLPNEHDIFITEIASSQDLGHKLDKVLLADSLASCLNHRMTYVALLARKESIDLKDEFASIYEWTLSAIEDQFSLPLLVMQGAIPLERDDASHGNAAALLTSLGRMIQQIGCCDERLQARLCRYFDLRVWVNAHSNERKAMLDLIQFFTPGNREVLEKGLLFKLDVIAKRTEKTDEASMLILSLVRMFGRWAAVNWQTTLRNVEGGQTSNWGTSRLQPDTTMIETIAIAVSWATTLANELLSKHPESLLLIHACLSLHEIIFADDFVGLHDLLLPPNLSLYLPSFSQTTAIMGLSRQFGIVHNVRQLHQDYLAAKAEDISGEVVDADGQLVPELLQLRRNAFYDEECSDRINDCVILLIDLIWRNNGFISAQNGNVDIGLPIAFFVALSQRCQGRGDQLQQIGSASHSAMLAVLMEAYANDLVRQRGADKPILHGPLTPAKLKLARSDNFPTISHRDFRDSFLTWLARQGARGVGDLLSSTITRFIRGQEVDQSTVFS